MKGKKEILEEKKFFIITRIYYLQNYLLNNIFKNKIASFSYGQVDSISRINTTYFVGLEYTKDRKYLFTFIDGETYKIHYSEQWEDIIRQVTLEKIPISHLIF